MRVWVTSGNTTERALLVASLAEAGFDARGFESTKEVRAELGKGLIPEVLVIDTLGVAPMSEELETMQPRAAGAKLVLISGGAPEPLPADLILRRPISIGELSEKIKGITGGVR
jgi:hypothetical protein